MPPQLLQQAPLMPQLAAPATAAAFPLMPQAQHASAQAGASGGCWEWSHYTPTS